MKIRLNYILIALVLLFAALSVASSFEEPKLDGAVAEALKESGKAKIIVTYSEDYSDHRKARALDGAQKTRDLKEVSSEELEELLKEGNIERIEYDYPVKAFLQDSVHIVNASTTWRGQISGTNLTGAGQTVCIIDTGVNYSNSNLGGCFGSGCKVIGGYDFVNNDADPRDDDGHGTHVAGIVAANGSVNGVAPGAKIVSIKALDQNGDGDLSDIMSGIDWCVGNASTYNISVISLSLGTASRYSSFCDSSFTSLASSVNNAVSNGIAVVVATGNDGDSTGISSPACLQNAIPVGSSTKSDTVASSSNRNSLLQLLAPGHLITSTSISGGSVISSGTSMATPHVSAAIAIMKQFSNLTGQTKNPGEIETILNRTGKTIYDSSSQRNYSRINLYQALNYMAFNSVTLVSPSNNSYINRNVSFFCNVSANANLSNITFQLWNSTGIENMSAKYVSGLSNSSNSSHGFLREGTYTWNCFAATNASFESYASSNFSVTYDITVPSVNVSSPVNGTWDKGNFTAIVSENSTCSYSLDEGINNISMSSQNNLTFSSSNNTLVTGNNYTVNYYCTDLAGNSNLSERRSFQADSLVPTVSLLSPQDGYAETASNIDFNFVYNVSDNLNITSCNLIINGVADQSNTSITNQSANHTFSKTLSSGGYSWNINCTDLAGNVANSSSRTITLTAPSSPVVSSGGGGGGGGGGAATSSTYTPSRDEANAGYTREVKKSDRIQLAFFDNQNERHTITVDSVEADFVNITIRSDPIKVLLGIGQSIKLNLTSAEYYDLYIKLDGIVNKKAILTIQSIREPIVQNSVSNEPVSNISEEEVLVHASDLEEKNRKNGIFQFRNILVALVAGLIVGVAVHLWDVRKKRRLRESIHGKIHHIKI